MSADQTHDERALRVRLAADPAIVPGARRFVADGLRAWGHDSLVDDASLCVSELAGNAALHGASTYIEICVLDLDQAVRLWVEDDGPAPVAAIAPRISLEDVDELGDELGDELSDLLLDAPATGRGLAIVSVLASDWGVEVLENCKRVWAELSAGDALDGHTATRPVSSTDTPPSADPPVSPEALPEGWALVRLAGCPVELSLLQDQHLDELVRELTLISVGDPHAESAELATHLEAILRAPAHARAAGRRQARAALGRGESSVDVEMAMPRAFSREVRRLHEAVRAADVLCDEARLLTLASPPELREFRDWMTGEIVGQIEDGAAPVRWPDWLAARR